jgi:uncharacterized protein
LDFIESLLYLVTYIELNTLQDQFGMNIQSLRIELPADVQVILAQSHFIKTIEDVSECLVNCVPGIKYGIGFCEASGACLVRHAGNDADLEIIATDYAYKLSSGHSLIILIRDAYPINILPRLREVPELVTIYCATANPIEVIFTETEQGRAILGVVDGYKSKGIETEKDVIERKNFEKNWI